MHAKRILKMATTTHSAAERREQGILHMAALLNHWLGSSGLSHEQLVAIASWGLGEPAGIDGGTISRQRNAKVVRGASWRHLDALAAANVAIWLWQIKGPKAAREELGPPSSWGIKDDSLDKATWLPSPDDLGEPLRLAEMAEVMAGYRQLSYLSTAALTPNEARHASDRLSQLLEATIAERGWGPKQAIRQLLEAYPVTDKARQRRLQSLIVGEVQLSREELEAEMHALAEMLRVLRGVKKYDQIDLEAELLPDRPARS